MRSLVALAALLSGCAAAGEGLVEADFDRPECPPGVRESALVGYRFSPQRLATERFHEVVIVKLDRFAVDVFETDGLGIRLDLDGLERAGAIGRDGEFYVLAASPLTVPIGSAPTEAQAVLSLFGTCPRFPGYEAVGGALVLDALRLRIDGAKTGQDERLAGRVEGPLGYNRAPSPVGQLRAQFDFEVPVRFLREFQ